MLFFQPVFVFCFLPLVLLVYHLLSKREDQSAKLAWLTLASLIFYGYWNLWHVPVLLLSIAGNYGASLVIARNRGRIALAAGIAFNLALLGYFKYFTFLGSLVFLEVSPPESFGDVVLPLGISFFTFQQIAYLVDVRKGLVAPPRWPAYALFVTFFPQLVAGPIVHHREMLPQFLRSRGGLKASHLAVGLTIFALGLFKKLVLADGLAPHADSIFDGVAEGVQVEFLEAWGGAVAFGLQLYFDFSGYSDMAIGLARLFGIRLPLNFYSPYKATSPVEFWRRWHITLSRFLRDLLYIPLGGNRKGPARRYANLMITMLLGGLWHGAGWTFILWGGLHGLFLAVTHFFAGGTGKADPGPASRRPPRRLLPRPLAVLLTFALVTLAWVPFRAAGFGETWALWETMLGLRGISLPATLAPWLDGLPGLRFEGAHSGLLVSMPGLAAWCLLSLAIVFFCPNVYELLRRYRPTVEGLVAHGFEPGRLLTWRPSLAWGLALAVVAVAAFVLGAEEQPAFLYYQF